MVQAALEVLLNTQQNLRLLEDMLFHLQGRCDWSSWELSRYIFSHIAVSIFHSHPKTPLEGYLSSTFPTNLYYCHLE